MIFSDPYFLHKDRIYDSVFIRKNTDQRELAFWHILCSVSVVEIEDKKIPLEWVHAKWTSNITLKTN